MCKMLYEMKKFYKNPAVMIVLVLAILLSISMPLFFINSYEGYDYSTGEEIVIRGLDALKDRKVGKLRNRNNRLENIIN